MVLSAESRNIESLFTLAPSAMEPDEIFEAWRQKTEEEMATALVRKGLARSGAKAQSIVDGHGRFLSVGVPKKDLLNQFVQEQARVWERQDLLAAAAAQDQAPEKSEPVAPDAETLRRRTPRAL